LTGSVFTSSQFAAFAGAIRHRESSDNYSDTKNPGYLGAYQMGISALEDAGFLVEASESKGFAQIKRGDWTPYAQSLGVKRAPGSPAGSSRSAIATGVDRGDVNRADAGQQTIFPRRGGHVASGHRNDPIFVY
jgi:hypothetical protein